MIYRSKDQYFSNSQFYVVWLEGLFRKLGGQGVNVSMAFSRLLRRCWRLILFVPVCKGFLRIRLLLVLSRQGVSRTGGGTVESGHCRPFVLGPGVLGANSD